MKYSDIYPGPVINLTPYADDDFDPSLLNAEPELTADEEFDLHTAHWR